MPRRTPEGESRMGPMPPPRSDDDGRLVNTEYTAESVADLAESGAGSDRIENERQEVVAAAGRPVHRLQSALGGVGIPALAQVVEALGEDLGQGRVDLEEVGRWGLLHH